MTDSIHIVELIDGYGFTIEEVAFAKRMDAIEVERIYSSISTFLNVNDRINNELVVLPSVINEMSDNFLGLCEGAEQKELKFSTTVSKTIFFANLLFLSK
ncbi:hypothetical protein [Sphingobacterium litopenaei]|uniref:Uncharacterized protein n=1 Tax=Sphingobacterium litopenaei TaxID=2763500 RepID=A0ABR7YH22_9SPHI|nr:hypothetical protein [Sphingobacterium litopenaei]MBD1430608.1 hypothetical protein [Sphingobacterium litopenaei]